jgi:aminopeptidase-like protein
MYPTLSTKKTGEEVRDMMNLLAYSDGSNSLIDIAEKIGVPLWELVPLVRKFMDEGLLKTIKEEQGKG